MAYPFYNLDLKDPDAIEEARKANIMAKTYPVGAHSGLVSRAPASIVPADYIKSMNESVANAKKAKYNRDTTAAANTLEAEREESKGWLRGSEQHRAQLEASIEDYDRQIAKLQAEIAMSEAGDPMYDLAIMRLIMDNDNSLLTGIRSRIDKKIDQEFQAKQKKADQEFQHNENELNRENTLEVAKMNKEEQKAAKQQDLENAFNTAAMMYDWAKRDLEANPTDKTLQRAAEKAKELYLQAATKANKDVHFEVGEATANPDLSEVFADYGVEGIDGIKSYLEDLKKTNLKTYERELKNLKYRGITEKDLGLSGGEEKVVSGKNKAADKLTSKVNAALKLGPFDDVEKATAALNGLEAEVKAKVKVGYNLKTGKYILKKAN